jgi:hypothetical protein
MAQVKVQYGCGCERMIETPGPKDPQGLLARLAKAGTVHRTPHPCNAHFVGKILRLPGHEHSGPAAGPAEAPAEAEPAPDWALVAAELAAAEHRCVFFEMDADEPIGCRLAPEHEGPHDYISLRTGEILEEPGAEGGTACGVTRGRGVKRRMCKLDAGHEGRHDFVDAPEVQTSAAGRDGEAA